MWGGIINTILGLWLMAAPGIFNYGSAASDNGHIVGPVIVTFAIVSLWEATRGVRKLNFPTGIWLIAAPWILGYDHTIAIISDMSVGLLVFLFAMLKGTVKQSFGGGWASLWQNEPDHMKKAKN